MWSRVNGILFRYFYLHKRSLPRTFEIVFWPVMELFVWGFLSVYIRSLSQDLLAGVMTALLSGMIFWDILYRSQQGVSVSIVEDIWTQNIVNILISPLRIWEWLLATFLYGFLKTLLITLILILIAVGLYHFNFMTEMGFYLVPLAANLFLFGWALGIFTSALVIRWGHAAEALIWGIPFLVQPLSAIYYPLSVLPVWLQAASKLLPSTYIFEGMREVIRTGAMPVEFFIKALILNVLWFVFAGFFFRAMYHRARVTGRLGRLGMD